MSELLCIIVRHGICIDKYSNLTTGRKSICFRNSWETRCNIFHFFNTLDVIFCVHATCPRADSTDGIGNLNNFRLDANLWNPVMMRFDDIDNILGKSVFSSNLRPNFRVCSFDIMIKRFPKIMEKSSFEGEF